MSSSREEMQHEIDALREAYASWENRGMNETMYGADSGMVKHSTEDREITAHGEIERLVLQLEDSVSSIDKVAQKIIEKTSTVAAMERSIPSEGDDVIERSPETQLGSALSNCISRINLISNRLNEHTYKLET